MIEEHPFKYFLPENPNKLIIGSFPCFNGIDYGDWFYSGSGKNDFWELLSKVFQLPAKTRNHKEELCRKNRIGITDIALKIKRKKGNCSDSNLEIIEYNLDNIKLCLSKGIDTIFFTSKFVDKHFSSQFTNLGIPTIVLLSPSPAANTYIATLHEYKKLLNSKLISGTFEYRLLKYKEALL
ncbi:hypothetical protein QQ008_07460 [Fulvivirgaceae bacterium BMA10]|uniref:Uracil-DNA glycosylase-like domain-containing protein n=1 Tax=Splendidivirga corallicola TaxID=3051826 RepID=A0ABT8KKE9_9BACT|nr:hypothetical protein [Fulvivirgaceae bacterium BMA10]